MSHEAWKTSLPKAWKAFKEIFRDTDQYHADKWYSNKEHRYIHMNPENQPMNERMWRLSGQIKPYPSKKVHFQTNKEKSLAVAKKKGMAKISFSSKKMTATPPKTPRSRGRSRTRSRRNSNAMSLSSSRRRNSAKRRRSRSLSRASAAPYSTRDSAKSSGRLPIPIRKTKKNLFYLKGSVKKVEQGGTATVSNSNGSVYMGHGTASRQVLDAICRAIVKKLFTMGGYTIADWTQKPNWPLTTYFYLRMGYQEFAAAIATIDVFVDTTKTWNETAEALRTAIINALSSSKIYRFEYIHLVQSSTTAPNTESTIPYARINLQDAIFNFKFTSLLAMQNNTVAPVIAGDTDNDLNDNIGVNPLKGKVYRQQKWCNGFILANTYQGDNNWVVDNQYGVIKNSFLPTSVSNQFVVPPNPWEFETTKAANIILNPGQVHKSYITFSCRITLGRLLFKAPNMFAQDVTQQVDQFGTAEMVGLCKQLDDRNESTIYPDIRFQLNQTYSAYIEMRKNTQSLPLIVKNQSAV